MLTDFLLNVIFVILWPFVAILPVASLPAGVQDALDVALSGIGFLWLVFPINAALTAITIVIGIEASLLAFKIGVFFFNKFRGSA